MCNKKTKLIEYIASNNPLDNYEFAIITNYQEIKDIIHENKKNFTKIIYHFRSKIHNILYDSEEMVNINFENDKINLNEYYYLTILIQENESFVNYTYSLDLIKKIDNLNNSNKSNLKKIIYSLIIISLINNYKNFNEEENREDKITINSIECSNINLIENNIDILKGYKLNLNDFKFNKLDNIYAQILKYLILYNDFEDYSYIYDIINDLDLENIEINKYLFDELLTILNNSIIKVKLFKNKEDFNNKKVINFNYILLKYILKNSLYIYNIPSLCNSRKTIIQIINSPGKIILNNNKDFTEYKERLYYNIKTLTDSQYYFNIFMNKIDAYIKKEDSYIDKDKTEDPFNEKTKENKIYNDNCQLIENEITANTFNEILSKNIIDYDNKTIQDAFCFNYCLKKFNVEDNDLNKLLEKDSYFGKQNMYINHKKILKFINNFNEKLKSDFGSYFNSNNDLEINLNFKVENQKNKNNIYNLTCVYCLKKLNSKYKDENILINGLGDGFQALLCDIEYEMIN